MDEKALIESTIERGFVRVLEGGCQVPIGINAQVNGDKVNVNAVLGLPMEASLSKKVGL